MTIISETSSRPQDIYADGTVLQIGDTILVKQGGVWAIAGASHWRTWDQALVYLNISDPNTAFHELIFAPDVRRIRGELEEAKRQHASDIAHIEETLNQEANDRDWCDEYDTILERLNSNLNIEIKPRKRTFTVDVTIVHTVEVVASDADVARDSAAYELTLDGDYEIQDIYVR